jgi:hypothetical protein
MRPSSSRLYPWYDSYWLTKYTEARAALQVTRPQLAREFEEALLPLRTRPDFRVARLDRIVDAITLDEVRRTASLSLSSVGHVRDRQPFQLGATVRRI